VIVAVNPNPAVDHVVVVGYRPGSTLRPSRAFDWPGGSGTHAACVARRLGSQVTLVTSLEPDGYGPVFRDMVRSRGIHLVASDRAARTRQTYSIVDDSEGNIVDIAEFGGTLTGPESDAFAAAARESLGTAQVCLISGSVMAGTPDTLPAEIVAEAARRGIRTVADVTGAILDRVVHARPWLLKPSLEELVRDGVVEASARSVLDVMSAWLANGVGNICLSLAGAGALWFDADAVRHLTIQPRPAYNTIGCGDAMVGAIAAAVDQGYALDTALTWGIAGATANLAEAAPGDADPSDVKALAETASLHDVSMPELTRLLDGE
jgi:fructose-1-phosphate kinase PfkB-like protein